MTLRQFHNALRILTSIDLHELVAAGVINATNDYAWQAFRADPFRWFLRASDETVDKLWALIEARQVKVPA